jgi:hypothetical protein
MHLQVRGGEEKGRNTRVHSPRLASLGQAGPGRTMDVDARHARE